jgi:hypothetical protein
MAGEQVILMEKPDTKTLLMWEALTFAAAFVVLFIVMSIFSDLPTHLKAGASVVFGIAGVALLHFFFATTLYLVTDKRLLIISELGGADLKDSCEVDEITTLRKVRFGNQLVVDRTNGQPIRLVGLRDRDEVEKVLIGE